MQIKAFLKRAMAIKSSMLLFLWADGDDAFTAADKSFLEILDFL